MNLDRLRQAQGDFLMRYPGGFLDPELADIGKKHNLAKMTALCEEQLAADCFTRTGPESITKNYWSIFNGVDV